MYRDRYIKPVRIFGPGGRILSLQFYYIYYHYYEKTGSQAGLTVGKYFTILTISELQNSFLNQGQSLLAAGPTVPGSAVKTVDW